MKESSDQEFRCPHCGESIEVSEIVADSIRSGMSRELKAEKEKLQAQAKKEVQQRLQREIREREEKSALELADLREQLEERNRVAEKAREHELQLRKKARELEQKFQDAEVEVQRKLDAGKEHMSRELREKFQQEYDLQLKEKEKQIEGLRKSVAEVKRKSEVGSQELQGETLEQDIEERLLATFPMDRISPVSKGVRGADLLQEVVNEAQESCGSIIWEAKNTMRWNSAWLDKLKDDQRQASAAVAVLVSMALPDGVNRFGFVEGVWICDRDSFIGLTIALRKHLIDLSFARQASRGKNEKLEMVYQYLSGDEFRQRIEAIVETFNAMQEQLFRERRAMEKNWKEREKQIERMTSNTVGLYGEIRGMIGSGLPPIRSLELDDD